MLGRVHHCPHCGSRAVCRARPNPFGRLAWFVFLHPIRCRDCNTRFWRLTSSPPTDEGRDNTSPR